MLGKVKATRTREVCKRDLKAAPSKPQKPHYFEVKFRRKNFNQRRCENEIDDPPFLLKEREGTNPAHRPDHSETPKTQSFSCNTEKTENHVD